MAGSDEPIPVDVSAIDIFPVLNTPRQFILSPHQVWQVLGRADGSGSGRLRWYSWFGRVVAGWSIVAAKERTLVTENKRQKKKGKVAVLGTKEIVRVMLVLVDGVLGGR